MPVEIVLVGEHDMSEAPAAMELANNVQSEFIFEIASDELAGPLRMHAFEHVRDSEFFDAAEHVRSRARGFHPFLIMILDSFIEGRVYNNLFGSHRGRSGLAVITTLGVAEIVIQRDRIVAYFLYYFARYALTFCAPHISNHEDTRGCIFDRKLHKRDIIESMRSRAFCDECRRSLLTDDGTLNARQFSALESILNLTGRIIRDGVERTGKPRIFVGSSTAGLTVANQIQELLTGPLSIVVWNQGTVFSLGDSTLEALENAVLEYSGGIFVFTPDDMRIRNARIEPIARDNVIFELGLFIGKLGRRRALLVQPSEPPLALPSDLHGITTAIYDGNERDLAVALGPAVNKIRRTLTASLD